MWGGIPWAAPPLAFGLLELLGPTEGSRNFLWKSGGSWVWLEALMAAVWGEAFLKAYEGSVSLAVSPVCHFLASLGKYACFLFPRGLQTRFCCGSHGSGTGQTAHGPC